MEAPVTPGLSTLTVRGLFWNYLSLAIAKLGGLLITVVAVRILTPAEFGLAALAIVTVDLLGIVKDLGLGAALIQNRSDDRAMRDSAFTLNLASGLLLTIVAVLAASPLASWAGESSVEALIRLLGLSFLFDAFGAVHVVLLRRDMDFRRKCAVDLARAFVRLLVCLGGLLGGFGVEALVAGTAAGAMAGSVTAWWLHRWVPRLRVDLGHAGTLLRFGGRLTVANALGVLERRAEFLIVTAWFGPTTLGFYSAAAKLPSLMADNLRWVTTSVMFPAYARIQHEPHRLRSALLDTMKFSSMAFAPIALGLALTADPIIRGVFGPQWVPAIEILRVLALSALFSAVVFHLGDFLNSVGRTDVVMRLAVLGLVVFIPSAVAGATAYGSLGVAFGRLIATVAISAVSAAVAIRIAGLAPIDVVRALGPAACGGATLTVAVMVVLQAPIEAPLPRLMAAVLVGALVYGATLWLVDPVTVRDIARRIRRARRKQRGSVTQTQEG